MRVTGPAPFAFTFWPFTPLPESLTLPTLDTFTSRVAVPFFAWSVTLAKVSGLAPTELPPAPAPPLPQPEPHERGEARHGTRWNRSSQRELDVLRVVAKF